MHSNSTFLRCVVVRDLRDERKRPYSSTRAGDPHARDLIIDSYLEVTALLGLKLAPEGIRLIDVVRVANEAMRKLLIESEEAAPAPVLAERISEALCEECS